MTTETIGDHIIYFVDTEGAPLSSEQDALDLLGQTYGTGADLIVVPVGRFTPEFFDLSSKLAGHFIQKLQNYQMRLVVLGDISAAVAASTALRDFVYETNSRGHHLFVADRAALLARL